MIVLLLYFFSFVIKFTFWSCSLHVTNGCVVRDLSPPFTLLVSDFTVPGLRWSTNCHLSVKTVVSCGGEKTAAQAILAFVPLWYPVALYAELPVGLRAGKQICSSLFCWTAGICHESTV